MYTVYEKTNILEENIYLIQDYMQGILDNLYSEDPLKKEDLDHCIEEICALTGNKFPRNTLTIEREKCTNVKCAS